MSLTRPNRFACATAHTFAFPGFDMTGLSPHAAGRLHAERAICVAGTFHPARGTRLVLAHHDKQADQAGYRRSGGMGVIVVPLKHVSGSGLETERKSYMRT